MKNAEGKASSACTSLQVERKGVPGSVVKNAVQLHRDIVGGAAGCNQTLAVSGLDFVGGGTVSEQRDIIKTKIGRYRGRSRREPGRPQRSGLGRQPVLLALSADALYVLTAWPQFWGVCERESRTKTGWDDAFQNVNVVTFRW